MACLLLCLDGPLQSWGSRSRFSERDTEREPTKSGVIGLLAAALGRPRGAPLDDLAALRMAVRVDAEGVVLRDYHTTLGVARADGSGPSPNAVLSNRYYLADAVFLVGLEGDAELLAPAEAALRCPRWPLALGRRSCPPSTPLIPPHDWDRAGELLATLQNYPWLLGLLNTASSRPRGHPAPETLRLVIECAPGSGEPETRLDVPISFAARRFELRRVRHEQIPTPAMPGGSDVPEPDAA